MSEMSAEQVLATGDAPTSRRLSSNLEAQVADEADEQIAKFDALTVVEQETKDRLRPALRRCYRALVRQRILRRRSLLAVAVLFVGGFFYLVVFRRPSATVIGMLPVLQFSAYAFFFVIRSAGPRPSEPPLVEIRTCTQLVDLIVYCDAKSDDEWSSAGTKREVLGRLEKVARAVELLSSTFSAVDKATRRRIKVAALYVASAFRREKLTVALGDGSSRTEFIDSILKQLDILITSGWMALSFEAKKACETDDESKAAVETQIAALRRTRTSPLVLVGRLVVVVLLVSVIVAGIFASAYKWTSTPAKLSQSAMGSLGVPMLVAGAALLGVKLPKTG